MNSEEKKKVLIIDDEQTQREDLGTFFADKGWDVLTAGNGSDALVVLKSISYKCDCIILDQRMPIMDGKEFIRELSKETKMIPIILLSAYVTDEDFKSYYQGKVVSRLKKPTDPSLIESMADNIRGLIRSHNAEAEKKFTETITDLHSIDEKSKKNEDALEAYFVNTIEDMNSSIFHDIKEHIFVVARRWNSWYPSFFDVPGGCYAIVSPLCTNRKRNRVHVIDPGFRFLKILTSLGISVKDIETCLISHNHPDHLGGVFEYIASRHVAGEDSTFICNPSTYAMLCNYHQKGVNVSTIGSNQEFINCSNKHPNKNCHVTLESFDTEHTEIGPKAESKAIIFNFEDYKPSRKVIILGDTAFDIGKHREAFMPKLISHDNKVIVLHIGSAQLKQRVGGHLYLQGVHKLLTLIGAELDAVRRQENDKLIVLISEWGLEHASKDQLSKINNQVILNNNNNSLIMETIDFLKKSIENLGYDKKMVVIPADIGLMVGIKSGKMYWKEGNVLKSGAPEDLKWRTNAEGLEYYL